ncbi:hypothetical protein EVAR_38745_1 [Eumeta japonica]|uniref:Uncharacterized protein n=1 Tax=Eumeta variegata TaxID=151549 RepID=A0A4C1YLV9_EUMVA|nr:hypothetical protein EVAR_38745_1 [Eumeta japonica]
MGYIITHRPRAVRVSQLASATGARAAVEWTLSAPCGHRCIVFSHITAPAPALAMVASHPVSHGGRAGGARIARVTSKSRADDHNDHCPCFTTPLTV